MNGVSVSILLQCAGKAQLLSWMQVLAKAEELSELVDPRLRGVYDKHQVSMCAQIALLCTRILPDLRPTMGEIRRFLDGTAEIPLATSLINSPNSSSRGSFVSECLTPSTTVSCYGTRASFITDCYNFSTGSCHGGDSVWQLYYNTQDSKYQYQLVLFQNGISNIRSTSVTHGRLSNYGHHPHW